jgi:hypothetical protein
MREKIELIQRGSVPDAMSNIAEPRGDGEKDILGGSGRAERAELPDCVVPTANAVEQPVTNEASEEVPRCGRRAAETHGGLRCGELGQTFADEVVEQLQTRGLSLGTHKSRLS